MNLPQTNDLPGATMTRRKLTKQQKHKKSQQKKFESDLPFSASSDDRDIVGRFAQSCLNDICLLSQREVPSLGNLCLQTRCIYDRYTQDQMPTKIWALLQGHLFEKHVKQSQLQWALNILLAAENNKYFYMKSTKSQGQPEENVSLVLNLSLSDINSDGSDVASAKFHQTYIPRNYIFGTQDLDCKIVLSALCTAIHLLLPPQLRGSSNQLCQTEDEALNQATTTAVVRVKIFLKKRYPSVLECLFDNALAYAFWSRGDLNRSLQLFKNLAARLESDATVARRTSILCEIARLEWLTGNRHEAIKSLHEAEQAMTSRHRGHGDDIEHQVLQQSAAVWDQGLQNTQTARHAFTAWTSVVHSVKATPQSIQAAIDSLLFIHSGIICDDGPDDWLKWVSAHLTTLARTYTDPPLHDLLAVISALRGLPEESDVHCRCFTERFGNESASTEEGPWKSLGQLVKLQNSAVAAIPLLWRTQLCHPVYKPTDGSVRSGISHVADLITDCMNLRLTPGGALTGDFQLLLPLLNPVLLNPFTGELIHKEEDTHQPWYSRPIAGKLSRIGCHVDCFAGLFSPRLTRLYDFNGVTVDMFLWNSHAGTMHDCTLHWTGPDGRTGKLRMKPLVRKQFKQAATELIEETYQRRINPSRRKFQKDKRDHEKWKRIMLEVLERNHSTGQKYSFDSLTRECSQIVKEGTAGTTSRSPPGGAAKSQQKARPYRLYYMTHRVVHKTLVIALCDGSQYGTEQATVLLFVQCHSLEEFQNGSRSLFAQYMESSYHSLWFDLDLPGTNYNHQRINGDLRHRSCDHIAQIVLCTMYCSSGSTVDQLLILSDKGDVLDMLFFEDREDIPYDVIATVIYSAHPHRMRAVADHREYFMMSPMLSGQIADMERADHSLLVLTSGGLHIVDAQSMASVPLKLSNCKDAPLDVSLSTNGNTSWISWESEENERKVRVLTSRIRETSTDETLSRFALQLHNCLLLVDITTTSDHATKQADVIWARRLPSTPRELCFISQTDGFLVTICVPGLRDASARDHILQFGYDGALLRVLLCLGPGSHDLQAMYLHGDHNVTETQPAAGRAGWYVYFRDQHGGLCCIRASLD